MSSAYSFDRQVAVGRFGSSSAASAAADDVARSRRVVLAHEFAEEMTRRCVEAVAARECARMPRDLKTALGNLCNGNGARSLGLVFAAACDPAVSVPLHAAAKLAAFPVEFVNARHHALAPDAWDDTALMEAHEANDAANAALNRAQMRERDERSVSALVQVQELSRVEECSARRLAHVARLALARKAAGVTGAAVGAGR